MKKQRRTPPTTTQNARADAFFALDAHRVLEAVESAGLRCTGRCLALNSLENRVYEVEVDPLSARNATQNLASQEEDETVTSFPGSQHHLRVVKFYRPGRWSFEQIQEEHKFLLALTKHDLPVIAPLPFEDGTTLRELPDVGLFFALFPKRGGRLEPELGSEQMYALGRLIARVHNVGTSCATSVRPPLKTSSYGHENADFLATRGFLPSDIVHDYVSSVASLCTLYDQLASGIPLQRTHGDCHHGNVLWDEARPLLLDFDDTILAPAVQDLWLMVPGKDPDALRKRSMILEGYEQFRSFDHNSWRLVEGLRGLRMIHFSAWIARRWEDPAFKIAFPFFGTDSYWRTQLLDVRNQLRQLQEQGDSCGD